MRNLVRQKDRVIDELRNELHTKDHEIAEQNDKIKNLQEVCKNLMLQYYSIYTYI